ncbi:hypothetical protein C2E23DRAFT_437629 [Lenzites betulinus]|nr:hypothetical protein C2E23DRAFT_437629 [Lenzites betulinus]
MFRFIRELPDQGDLLFSHIFTRQSHPSLLDALVAAATLHEHSPTYILSSRQCYWYANMLMAALLAQSSNGKGTLEDPPLAASALQAEFNIAYDPASTSSTVRQKVVPGPEGTFKGIFRLVTTKDIDELYDSEIKGLYETKLQTTRKVIEEWSALQKTRWGDITQVQKEVAEDVAKARQNAAAEVAAAEEARLAIEQAKDQEIALLREETALLREQIAQSREAHSPVHAK